MVKKQTSGSSWQQSLNGILAEPDPSQRIKKLAIVGIGNEYNGDDAAGVIISRKLHAILTKNRNIKVFEAGQALENITGALIRFEPDVILFIDAVSIGERPGTIQMLDWRSSIGFSASTHSLPLNMVVEYILHEHQAQVFLVGIQIRDTTVGSTISPEVKSSTRQIINLINDFFSRSDTLPMDQS